MRPLDAFVRSRLLALARQAIEADLLGLGQPAGLCEPWPVLTPCGAFVAVRKSGTLRGCIGTFEPDGDLPNTIARLAVAAIHDFRFTGCAISMRELPALAIEVSVLSPLRRLDDPLDFELGVHGVLIRRGSQSGCFLPQVATERGFDREQFLSACCEHKASMEPHAWRDHQTQVFVFTVDKFSDGPAPGERIA